VGIVPEERRARLSRDGPLGGSDRRHLKLFGLRHLLAILWVNWPAHGWALYALGICLAAFF